MTLEYRRKRIQAPGLQGQAQGIQGGMRGGATGRGRKRGRGGGMGRVQPASALTGANRERLGSNQRTRPEREVEEEGDGEEVEVMEPTAKK